MTESSPTSTTPLTTAASPAQGDTTDWKAMSRQWEQRAKENANAAAEVERLTGELSALATERDAVNSEALRYRVALSKGLPPTLADRLRGGSEDEVSQDADRLLELITPTTPRFGTVDQGVQPQSAPTNPDVEFARSVFGPPT